MKYSSWHYKITLLGILLIGAYLLPLLAAGQANVYYVSVTGKDSNDGSQSNPWATLAHANSAFVLGASGTVINVTPGTYAQGAAQLTLTRGGASNSAPVTYQCLSIRGCTISSTITGNNTVVQINGSYVRLIGFNITGASSAIPNLNTGVYITGHDVWLKRNTISNIQADCSQAGGGGIAIATGGGSGDVFDANIIHDIGWAVSSCANANTVHGINLEPKGPGTATVTNNIVYRVKGGWCIQQFGASVGTTGTVIANNLLFSCGNGGIVFGETGGTIDYNTVINNIILNNGTSQPKNGIYEYAVTGTHNIYANNDVFGNAGANYKLSAGSQSGGISIDPSLGTTFMNWREDGSGDYHLQSDSVAVSAGTINACAAGSSCIPVTDFDGNVRLLKSPFAVGVFTAGSLTATAPAPPTALTAIVQ